MRVCVYERGKKTREVVSRTLFERANGREGGGGGGERRRDSMCEHYVMWWGNDCIEYILLEPNPNRVSCMCVRENVGVSMYSY